MAKQGSGAGNRKGGGSALKRNKLWLGGGRSISRLVMWIAIAGLLALPAGLLLDRGGARAGESGASAGVRINELMSENTQTLVTETGDVPDWIEIYNAGSESVELKNWALLLETDPTGAYRFPDRALAPGEYMVVYAVGNAARGECEAPFRLPASGGDGLILLDARGQTADAVALPELSADCSYQRNEGGEWAVSEAPTPGGGSEIIAQIERQAENPVAGELEITEVMSANSLYLPDEDGEYCDYVEIHNRSGASVNLAGWYLSDSVSKLKRWSFPSVTLGADGYLTVHCSGKNRTGDPAHLHTDFKLSASGEGVYLSRPDGQTASSVELPALEKNQAWSLCEGAWSASLAPTPGAQNSIESASALQARMFQGALSGVYLSEIAASPTEEEYDWIELHNASNQPIDISNYGLSDDASRPRRWQFPGGTILQPGQYLGVLLTGDASVTVKNYLCAPFALASGGGTLSACLTRREG